MFQSLVLPLRDRRTHAVEMDFAEETAISYHRQSYRFEDVDVIVLEGIFLLKRAYRSHFDLSFWVDCTFETALDRALARRQEGLSERDTVTAYHTIYFPAQRIHCERDDPRAAASAILNNDPRLAVPPALTLLSRDGQGAVFAETTPPGIPTNRERTISP